MQRGNSSTGGDERLEELIATAVTVLEQSGEGGLQQFLGEHAPDAHAIREGLERLRRLGVLAPPPAAALEVEQYGEFRILRRLAAGGMGVVWLAEQTSLQRRVALKVVRPELLLSEIARERFQREVETIAKLQHPGIVPILAVGTHGTVPWFAMEYVEGRSLDALIETLRHRGHARAGAEELRAAFGPAAENGSAISGAFSGTWWEACVRIVLQVAHAMSYVHARGIVHRDLKPSNVMVTPRGQALVLDFGLAHVQDAHRVTRVEAPVGSPAYMAPEQVRGEAVDERVDVYGLGVTLYQLLSGELPFTGDSQRALQQAILAGGATSLRTRQRTIPRDLDIVCLVALERDRARRYASMADFAADLERVLARQPIRARPLGVPLRLVRWCQRHPVVAAAAAALLVVALQFPLVLWRLEASNNERLASVNAELRRAHGEVALANEQLGRTAQALEQQRAEALANYHDTLDALHETMVRVGHFDLAATPGSELLRVTILTRVSALYERLRERRPGEAQVELDAARALQYLGQMHQAIGSGDRAEASFHEVLARLATQPGDDATLMRGITRKLLGQSLSYRGANEDAERVLREGWCELQDVVGRAPADRTARRHLAEVCNSLGVVRRVVGDHDAALELLTTAQTIKEALRAEEPDDLAGTLSFALGCANLASSFERDARRDEALALLQRGVDALVAIRPTGPESAVYRVRLSGLHDRLGNWYREAGDLDRAEAEHGTALALRLELAADFPDTASYDDLAGSTLHNLAMVCTARRDAAAALAYEIDAKARLREAVRAAPHQRLFAQHLEYAAVGCCNALLSLQRYADLEPALADLAAVAVSAEGDLNACRVAARAARLWRERDGERVTAAAERLCDLAVQCAEAAVARGFGDVAHFETGRYASYYADLRRRPDFVALLARLRRER